MPRSKESAPDLDALYGLEPVIEPADEPSPCSASLESRSVECPYCGEAFLTVVDPSAGSASYIEDCQVCCQPIEFALEVESDGTVGSLGARRCD